MIIDMTIPAFPTTRDHGFNSGMEGMTLRDYFAAKAMQGLLSDTSIKSTPDHFAFNSYMVADTMMKARIIIKEQ